MFAVAIHVDYDVASKFLTKIERHLCHKFHGKRVVAVDVENWRFNHFRDVGGVHRRARVFGQRCEADLVVHDYVHGAASAVTRQLRHVEGFRDDPLPRKGRIPMNKERQNFPAMVGIVTNALTRACRSLDNRIDRFKMAWITRKPDFNLGAGTKLSHRAIPKMVLHIAIPCDQIGNVVFGEFSEDNVERFLQEVSEHIETATVCHAHANLRNAGAWAFVKNGIKNHHQRFSALQRKALLPDVMSM